MEHITPAQSASARQQLGLSQAKVAKETKINRTYLSQFESGKRILPDLELLRLSDFYESLGWSNIGEGSLDSSVQMPASEHYRIADGFVIAEPSLMFDLEDLLDEYQDNDRKVRELVEAELPRGFLFGGLNHDEAVAAALKPLVLMAANCQIQQILHGTYEVDNWDLEMADEDSITTVGDYITALINRFSRNRSEIFGFSNGQARENE